MSPFLVRGSLVINDQLYKDAIRKKVCVHCIDFGADGQCKLSSDRQCGVEIYLDKIIGTIRSVKSNLLQDYIEALRKNVCSECKNQNPNGTCRLRSEAECGLDRYFEMVVEAIEEVEKYQKK